MYRRPNGWNEVSQEEITTWVERYRASSLGLRRFAEENGISVQRLRYWVYDKSDAKASGPRLELAPIETATAEVPPVFQEIKLPVNLAQPCWAPEVSLPNGVAIRFNNLPKPIWLGSLVETLRRPC
jgi:hypothetical protein